MSSGRWIPSQVQFNNFNEKYDLIESLSNISHRSFPKNMQYACFRFPDTSMKILAVENLRRRLILNIMWSIRSDRNLNEVHSSSPLSILSFLVSTLAVAKVNVSRYERKRKKNSRRMTLLLISVYSISWDPISSWEYHGNLGKTTMKHAYRNMHFRN